MGTDINEGTDVDFVERSAGIILVRGSGASTEALVIRIRRVNWELPKGHVEPGETDLEAAVRELREETGLESHIRTGECMGSTTYTVNRGGLETLKIVNYFLAVPSDGESPIFGKLPRRTRELRWVGRGELATLLLVNRELRPLIAVALERAG